MKDHMASLREEAARKQQERQKEKQQGSAAGRDDEEEASREVAEYLGVEEDLVANCCGSICPHCDIFLDKAIALVELGRPHHLFMNPSQEEKFHQALELYRKDRAQYAVRRQDLMESMRR